MTRFTESCFPTPLWFISLWALYHLRGIGSGFRTWPEVGKLRWPGSVDSDLRFYPQDVNRKSKLLQVPDFLTFFAIPVSQSSWIKQPLSIPRREKRIFVLCKKVGSWWIFYQPRGVRRTNATVKRFNVLSLSRYGGLRHQQIHPEGRRTSSATHHSQTRYECFIFSSFGPNPNTGRAGANASKLNQWECSHWAYKQHQRNCRKFASSRPVWIGPKRSEIWSWSTPSSLVYFLDNEKPTAECSTAGFFGVFCRR